MLYTKLFAILIVLSLSFASLASVTMFIPRNTNFITGKVVPEHLHNILTPTKGQKRIIISDYSIMKEVNDELEEMLKVFDKFNIRVYKLNSYSPSIESIFVANYFFILREHNFNYLMLMPASDLQILANLNANNIDNYFDSNFNIKIREYKNLSKYPELVEIGYVPDNYIFQPKSLRAYASKPNMKIIDVIKQDFSFALTTINIADGGGTLADNLLFNDRLILACKDNLITENNQDIKDVIGGNRDVVFFSKEQIKNNALDAKFIKSSYSYLLVNKDSFAQWSIRQKRGVLAKVRILELDFSKFEQHFGKKIRHLIIDSPD